MADIDNIESRLEALEAYIPPGGGLLVTAVGMDALLQPIRDALSGVNTTTGQINNTLDSLNNGITNNTGSIGDLQNATNQAAVDLQSALDSLNTAVGQTEGLAGLIDSEGGARVAGDSANVGAVLTLQDLFDGVQRWSETYTPTTALPDKLRNSDGTWPLMAGTSYLYECEAVTDAGDNAVAEFSFDGAVWSVRKVSESGTIGASPKFIVDGDGDPAVRPYASTNPVRTVVQFERHNSKNTVGAVNAAAIASESVVRSTADSQMASTVNLIGAKNGAGTAFVLNQGTALIDASTTLAQYISGVQAGTDNALGAAHSAASVATAAQATANAVTGKFNASYTVTLDVDGNVSGIIAQNNGATSSFTVAADKFSIVKPGGGASLTWQNGLLVNTNGSVMSVTGPGFGVGSNLMEWYGPAMAVSSCSKANAITWKDTSGSAYFGGTLTAGLLKNAATSTQVSNTASVDTGVFGTNGHSKLVVASLTYRNSGVVATDPGGASTSATVTLQRSYNGAAWTTIGSFTATGSRTSDHEPGTGYIVTVTCGGSVTVTDNLAGTGTFDYRAVIGGAAGGWPYVIPGHPGSQTLTVVSTES